MFVVLKWGMEVGIIFVVLTWGEGGVLVPEGGEI